MFALPFCPTCKEVIPEGSERIPGAARCPRCQQIVLIGVELIDPPMEVLPVEEPPDVLPVEEPLDVLPVDKTDATPPPPKSILERLIRAKLKDYAGKILMIVLCAPLLGVGLLIEQFNEPQLSNQVPEVMSCKELIKHGAADKAHVVLTDFRFETNRLVGDMLRQDKTTWSKAFVPIVPADAPEGQQPVRILMETNQAKTLEQLLQLKASNRVQGLVLRGDGSLEFTERVRLEMKYPKTDWKNCYLLQHGQAPSTPKDPYFNIPLGVALILSGGPIYYVAWRVWRASRKRPSG